MNISKQPFLHGIIDNFLSKKEAKELLQALAKEKFFHKESDLFSLNQTHDLKSSKNKVILKFIKLLTGKEFLNTINNNIKMQLKPIIDISGTIYADTDYLLCHDDRLEGRKLAFIYYLSTLSKQDGGSLTLIGKIKKKIQPTFNTLVFFEVSKKSLHEVEEVINCQRLALGGWIHG